MITRVPAIVLLVALCWAFGGCADAPRASTVDPLTGVLPEFTRPVRAEFDRAPLRAVFNDLERQSGLRFDVHWPALSGVGIEPGTAVTLSIPQAPLRVVLDRLCRRSDLFRLDYDDIDGAVVVTTAEDLCTFIVTRIYDVNWLSMAPPDAFAEPLIPPPPAGGGGGGSDSFENDHSPSPEDQRAEAVASLITSSIDPDHWQQNGGTLYHLERVGGRFVVTTTRRNHRRITAMLKKLRDDARPHLQIEFDVLAVRTAKLAEVVGARRRYTLEPRKAEDLLALARTAPAPGDVRSLAHAVTAAADGQQVVLENRAVEIGTRNGQAVSEPCGGAAAEVRAARDEDGQVRVTVRAMLALPMGESGAWQLSRVTGSGVLKDSGALLLVNSVPAMERGVVPADFDVVYLVHVRSQRD